MDRHIILSVLALCLDGVIGTEEATGSCNINLPDGIPKNEPVYLVANDKGNYSLYTPTDWTVTIEQHKQLLLLCSGYSNTFNGYEDYNALTVMCNEESKFQMGDHQVDLSNLSCKNKLAGSVRTTQKQCANGQGVENEIGFQVSPSVFVKLIDACYNNSTASAIYTKHYINGKAIEYHVKESDRRKFQDTAIPKYAHPTVSYKQAAIERRFSRILGASQNFFRIPKTISRGHLAPDADFVFRWGQFATYFYINVVPQFQDMNNGNWKRVEHIARELASSYEKELLVYTGTYEQLELPNANGKLVPLWLEDENVIEVPKWMWKIVIDEENNAGIAFVSLNNPYANKNELAYICKDICEETGLKTKGFKTISKGYTYCCDVNELATVIGILPKPINVYKLLESRWV